MIPSSVTLLLLVISSVVSYTIFDSQANDNEIKATDRTETFEVNNVNDDKQLEELFKTFHENELRKLQEKYELREEGLVALLEKFQYFDKTKSSRTRGKYLGCYQDRVEHRGLKGFAVPSNSMNVEKCIEICRSGSYVYAGLQAGSWCLCGNTKQHPIINMKLSETSCNSYCSGNASQNCGSAWVNAIYETGIEQFLIDEEGRQLPDSYIRPSAHAYFFLRDDGQAEN